MEIAILLAVLVVIVVGINYGIHRFFGKKQEVLLEALEGRNYTLIRTIKTDVTSFASWQRFTSDVIFIDDSVIVLLGTGPKFLLMNSPSISSPPMKRKKYLPASPCDAPLRISLLLIITN